MGKPLGALVRGVEVGAPADKAGVEAGDIITKFEGKVVEKSSDLPRMVGSTKPGTRSTLTVFRRGAYKDLMVTIAEIEAEKPTAAATEPEVKPKPSAVGQVLGLSVTELTAAQKKELKVKGGVRVETSVEAAARAGILEDDVIVAVGNTEIMGLKDFEVALAKSDRRKPLAVVIRRGEMAQIVVIRPTR